MAETALAAEDGQRPSHDSASGCPRFCTKQDICIEIGVLKRLSISDADF
jgi:hypothetical protein